jgi:23S rRNA (cytidine1920-2'-O)/16S rRNA (cytidine1409-2'-O)-methyltransferase
VNGWTSWSIKHGLTLTRQQAQSLIMAGKVLVNGHVADKPGMKVSVDVTIERLSPPDEERYVSRGALKLEKALDSFFLNPAELVAIDIGASTGGFTDLLLDRGAKQVYAIDVGTGQLAWRLREDPRVVVMERTNIRSLQSLPEGVRGDCAVIDVSFISLRLVLPCVAPLLTPSAWIVALVKPQFEAGKREVDRGGGVIRDPEIHCRILTELMDWTKTSFSSYQSAGLIGSPITGRDGNHEYLIYLKPQIIREEDPPQTPLIDIPAIVTATFTSLR